MTIIGRLVGTFVVLAVLLASCDKQNVALDNQQDAQDDVLVDDMQNSINLLIETNIDDNAINSVVAAPSFKSTELSYPIIEVAFPTEGALWPRVITVDFGPENVEMVIGNPNASNAATVNVRGKFVVTKTAPYFSALSERSIVTDALYINDYLVELTANCTNNGLNAQSNYEFAFTSDLKVSDSYGNSLTREADLVREMVAGDNTPLYIWDDEYLVSGTASGVRASGWSYSHVINQLDVKFSCRFPVSGTISVTNKLGSFIIDYGQGECDNIATITDSKGNDYSIELNR
jgi:hypothetical protein